MKYLTLIDPIALLYQYQREVKTVQHGGETLEYIEVSAHDIDVANRLAHQVLGRTLDELPPQTRRLLGLLDEMVTAACAERAIHRRDFRFSRRQVREHTGWGQTQLKVHLARLVEMEYLAVHRSGHAQAHLYELCYEARGRGGSPLLSGLIDSGDLARDAGMTENRSGLEGNRSGVDDDRSGSGRGAVGPRSGSGRTIDVAAEGVQSANAQRIDASSHETVEKSQRKRLRSNSSHPHLSVATSR